MLPVFPKHDRHRVVALLTENYGAWFDLRVKEIRKFEFSEPKNPLNAVDFFNHLKRIGIAENVVGIITTMIDNPEPAIVGADSIGSPLIHVTPEFRPLMIHSIFKNQLFIRFDANVCFLYFSGIDVKIYILSRDETGFQIKGMARAEFPNSQNLTKFLDEILSQQAFYFFMCVFLEPSPDWLQKTLKKKMKGKAHLIQKFDPQNLLDGLLLLADQLTENADLDYFKIQNVSPFVYKIKMGSETIHPDTFNYFLPFSFSHNLFSDNFREIILMRRGIHEEEWKEFRVLKLTDKQGVGCQYTLKMDENGLISQSATSRIFWRLHVVETKTDLSVEFNEIDGKEIVEASWKDELGKPETLPMALFVSISDEKNPIFGKNAEKKLETDRKSVIHNLLSLIGKPFDEIQIQEKWGFDVLDTKNAASIQIENAKGKVVFRPEFLLALLLKEFRKRVFHEIDDEIGQVSIVGVENWSELKKRLVLNAFKLAGFQTVKFL